MDLGRTRCQKLGFLLIVLGYGSVSKILEECISQFMVSLLDMRNRVISQIHVQVNNSLGNEVFCCH